MDKNTLIIVGVVGLGFFLLMNQRTQVVQNVGGSGPMGPGSAQTNQTASDFFTWAGGFVNLAQQGADAYAKIRDSIRNPTPSATPTTTPART